MDEQARSERLAALMVAVLLILTALGNAVLMLIAGVLGLVAGWVLLRKQMVRGSALAAAVGCALAVIIGLVMLLIR